MTAFNIGEIVVFREFECASSICEITGILYECRLLAGASIKTDHKKLRPATPEERATFVAAQTQKLDKQIADLMAYRKQLEDGIY